MRRTNNSVPLADPDQHPGADVVIYDGECRFCTAQVQRLARFDGRDRLAFLSLHDPRVSRWCPDLTEQELLEQMYVVTRHGTRYGGAAAVRYLSRRLPRLWLLAPWLHIPGSLPLWQWLYMQVARRRYRYGKEDPCDAGQCDIHYR